MYGATAAAASTRRHARKGRRGHRRRTGDRAGAADGGDEDDADEAAAAGWMAAPLSGGATASTPSSTSGAAAGGGGATSPCSPRAAGDPPASRLFIDLLTEIVNLHLRAHGRARRAAPRRRRQAPPAAVERARHHARLGGGSRARARRRVSRALAVGGAGHRRRPRIARRARRPSTTPSRSPSKRTIADTRAHAAEARNASIIVAAPPAWRWCPRRPSGRCCATAVGWRRPTWTRAPRAPPRRPAGRHACVRWLCARRRCPLTPTSPFVATCNVRWVYMLLSEARTASDATKGCRAVLRDLAMVDKKRNGPIGVSVRISAASVMSATVSLTMKSLLIRRGPPGRCARKGRTPRPGGKP